MPSILITGSSGFIGQSASAAFRKAGWKTFGVGRRELDQPGYLRFDLSQPFDTRLNESIHNSDVVIHAAARSSPWGSRRQFQAANVTATRNVIEACQKNGNPRLIFISSSSVYYQSQDQFDVNESAPSAPHPLNHYVETKQIGEQIVRQYAGQWTIFRPRAVYGKGDTVLFPRILAAAQAGKLPLLTRAGPPVIGDLISVDNLTHCLMMAANDSTIRGEFNLTDNEPQEIIAFLLNIFDRLNIKRPQKEVSVKTAFRLARVIEWLYGSLLPWKEPPITRFGVHVFAYSKTFDVSKMIETFGQPKLNTEQAIEQFVSWVKREDPYRLN